MLGPVVLGALLGGGLALVASRHPARSRRQPLAIGLGIAALIYVVFAVVGGGGARWLGIELAGLLGFAALAWMGIRSTALWLALGWTVHVAWDIGLHPEGAAPFVPSWYPLLCVGFDLIVAGYALGVAIAPAEVRR
jgi:hypothetical protein